MPVEREADLREILELDTIAGVGCSSTPGKEAHGVPRFMKERGYDVVPVNPYAEEIFGRPAYDSISEVDADVDLVNVFRPSDEVGDVVDEALERDDWQVLWTQLGIRDPEAGARVEAAGRKYVENRCIKVAYRRLM